MVILDVAARLGKPRYGELPSSPLNSTSRGWLLPGGHCSRNATRRYAT